VEKARKAIGKSYVRVEELREMKVEIAPANETAAVESTFGGKRLFSEDGTDVVWVRPQGICISRLTPYKGWEHFRQNAQDAWTKWRNVIGMRDVTRIGLRYINRIDIPVPESGRLRIEDFLLLSPSYRDPNQSFYSYTIQTQLPLDEFVLVINTGSAPPALINHLSYLFDLDVSKEGDLPRAEDDVWALVDRMRISKNDVFESYITDATRRLFG
jgi:uncharacterized protein (TIGR04255 family)